MFGSSIGIRLQPVILACRVRPKTMQTYVLNLICHSGGAEGADLHFDKVGREYGVETVHFSYRTNLHEHLANKREISKEEFEEGKKKVLEANAILKRPLAKYMNLVSRNYAIIKDVKLVLAVGKKILKKGTRSNPSNYDVIMGGTGVAVLMACLEPGKKVFVFDQSANQWFDWSANQKAFREYPGTPVINESTFAGIGTRELSDAGKEAIRKVFVKTAMWMEKKQGDPENS